MTLLEKAAHFYRTDVDTVDNFAMAFFSTSSPESKKLIIVQFLELHTGKVCKQTILDVYKFLEEYCKEYLI